MNKGVGMKMTQEEKEWRAQSDLRTLRDAEEIRNDKSRLEAAMKEAKKQMEALHEIAGKEVGEMIGKVASKDKDEQ